MTARLLPSRRPSHVTPLEAAAYDVIDDVLDVLQQAEDRAADAADVAEARLSLDRHLATFTALAAKTQAAKTPRTKGKDRMSTETLTTSETRIAVVVSHPDFGPPLEMYLDFDLNPLTADSAIKTAARFHERTGYRAIARRVTRSVETTVETITLYDSEIDER